MVRRHSHQFAKTLISVALLAIEFAASTAVRAFAQSGTWATTGSMSTARSRHTSTLLPNGQVLVAGGINKLTGVLASAELYNPTTGQWSMTGNMATARWGHSATILANGEVLVAGGSTVSTGIAPTAEAELYNPSTGKWTTTGSMRIARALHGSALLVNGQVLVAGDNGSGTSAELYDPQTHTWTATGSMNVGHVDAHAALLQDGGVLMAGGTSCPCADIYSNGHWKLTSQSNYVHFTSRTTLLTNGDVLVIGGARQDERVESYNPATDTWVKTGPLGIPGLDYGPLARLFSGKVLLAGGRQITYGGIGTTGKCALYDPSTNSWVGTGQMSTARLDHTTTLLPNGRVLAVGGKIISSGRTTVLASAELYTP